MIGMINGEEIKGYEIVVLYDGDESDTINNNKEKDKLFKTLKDVYERIKEAKESDRKISKEENIENLWSYEVNIETDTSVYGGYKVVRRKNKLKLI